jgi:hypothetical protein
MERLKKLGGIVLSALSAVCLLCPLVSCANLYTQAAEEVVRKLNEVHETDILSYADLVYYAHESKEDGDAYWAVLNLKVEPTEFLSSYATGEEGEKDGTYQGWYYSKNTDGADSADWTWTGNETMATKATGACYWRAGNGSLGVARLSLYVETKAIFFYEDTY